MLANQPTVHSGRVSTDKVSGFGRWNCCGCDSAVAVAVLAVTVVVALALVVAVTMAEAVAFYCFLYYIVCACGTLQENKWSPVCRILVLVLHICL